MNTEKFTPGRAHEFYEASANEFKKLREKLSSMKWQKALGVADQDKESKLFYLVVLTEVNGFVKRIIAKVWGKTREEAEANANLIAAAPLMYEALKEFVECDRTSGTHMYAAFVKCKAALSKANPQLHNA